MKSIYGMRSSGEPCTGFFVRSENLRFGEVRKSQEGRKVEMNARIYWSEEFDLILVNRLRFPESWSLLLYPQSRKYLELVAKSSTRRIPGSEFRVGSSVTLFHTNARTEKKGQTFFLASSNSNIVEQAPSTTFHSLASSSCPFEVAAVTVTAITDPEGSNPAISPLSSEAFPNANITRQKGSGAETRESSSGKRGR